MPTNLDALRTELKKLLDLSATMLLDVTIESPQTLGTPVEITPAEREAVRGKFRSEYQTWYTTAHEVVRQLIPSRLPEFDEAYKSDPRRKVIAADTYKIQDWLLGLKSTEYDGKERFPHAASVSARFKIQRDILAAAAARLESAVFDMAQIVRADLFDTELDAASELLRVGFARAAGIVAGVVLEKHLASIAVNHQVKITKKDPAIADLNEALKAAAVYDVPTWRHIQRLADIRNLCGHNKTREPTTDEVSDLIDGTTKVSKTIY